MRLGRPAAVLAAVALALTGCGDDQQKCHGLYDAPWFEIAGKDLPCPPGKLEVRAFAQHDVDGDRQDDAFVSLRCKARKLGHESDRLEVFLGGTACDNPKMTTVVVYERDMAILDQNLLVRADGVYTSGKVGGSNVAWSVAKDKKGGAWEVNRLAFRSVFPG